MKRWKFVVLFLFLAVLFTADGRANVLSPHQRAMQYLQTALTFIQQQSVNIGTIDWAGIQKQALAQAQDAQTPTQTYPVIQWTLQQLGDNHSFFLTPKQASQWGQGKSKGFGMLLVYNNLSAGYVVAEVFPGSPADKAGVQVGDQLQRINGTTILAGDTSVYTLMQSSSIALTLTHRGQSRSFSVTLTATLYDMNLKPQWQALTHNIGYIELPALEGGSMVQQYANIVQQDIATLDQVGVRGWIVDLRLDEGGNMWPMLAGIGPVLGEGKEGSFVFNSNKQPQTWFYRDGRSFLDQTMLAQVASPYHLKHALPPVAILTSPYTGSSGEAMVVAFRARPQTRSFGEPTAGVPTANSGITLSDGAVLVVTEALDADRTGTTYDSAISPNQPIPTDWRLLGTADDPLIQSSIAWLQMQKA